MNAIPLLVSIKYLQMSWHVIKINQSYYEIQKDENDGNAIEVMLSISKIQTIISEIPAYKSHLSLYIY